jgi:hypothetical protein
MHAQNSKLLYNWRSVSQYVLYRARFGACDQILFPFGMLLSEICGLISARRPLWREDGSTICSAITQWSESRRTRNNTLLSHLRLPQPGGSGSRVYISQEQGGPVILPGFGFPWRRLLRPAGLLWRYSNPSPNWRARSPYIYIYIPQELDGPVQSQTQKSKSPYDRRSVNQYVLVSSPCGFRWAPFEQLYNYHRLGYVNGK